MLPKEHGISNLGQSVRNFCMETGEVDELRVAYGCGEMRVWA